MTAVSGTGFEGALPTRDEAIAAPEVAAVTTDAPRGAALTILAAIAGVWAMQWAQAFLIPLALALFLAYTLDPIVSWLHRWRISRSIGAALVLCGLVSALVLTADGLRHEAARIVNELPRAVRAISLAVTSVTHERGGAVGKVREAAEELARATGETPARATAGAPGAVQVIVEENRFELGDFFWEGSLGAIGAVAQLVIVIFLVFFLLQAGDTFRRRLVKIAGTTLSEKKITVKILDDITVSIQRYLFMLLVTNTLLGLASWIAFRVIGLHNAGAWGVATGVLHMVPYFGSVIVALASGAAAFLQFGAFSTAFLVIGVCLVLATLIGVLVTTWMTGRLAKMNPTAVFVALLFFGWLWGPWGLFLAIPIVVAIKVTADHVESLQPVAELLGS